MSYRNLLIVESPNKTAKVQSILGDDWKVVASKGHVRDLPQRDIAISAPHYQLGYEVTDNRRAVIDALRKLAAGAEKVYLATDPDREGEAIAWHLKDELRLSEAKYERVTFSEIVATAVKAGVAAPRRIDMERVHAQEARRAVDRLVGYKVSPLLWDAVGSQTSAGRVQTPAVRLVYDRDKAIASFKAVKHYGVSLAFDKDRWSADWLTKPHLDEGQAYVLDAELARRAASCSDVVVVSSDTKMEREQPPAPFSTVNLLRAASVRLQLDPDQVMSLAQDLFEGPKDAKEGYITYHRSDAVNLGEEAVARIRQFAAQQGWKVPASPRRFKESAEAQAGHEGIRPANIEARSLGTTQAHRDLYDLIWDRAVASQLEAAVYSVTTLILQGSHEGQTFQFRATGRVLLEPGWRVIGGAHAAEDDDEQDEGVSGGAVPATAVGTRLSHFEGKLLTKQTRAPARYTKASLLQTLESMGIGRPSTFASIIKNILDRGYISERARKLHCEPIGAAVIEALCAAEFQFVDYGYTRAMEADLDAIAGGARRYLNVVSEADATIERDLARAATAVALKPLHACGKCGRALRRLKGERGYFWSCSGYREQLCDEIMDDAAGKPVARISHPCPSCAKPMYRRKGGSGFFWGCSGFRDGCTETLPDAKGRPGTKPKPSEHCCDACGKPLMRRTKAGKSGYDFYGCTGFPECKQTYGVGKGGAPIPAKGK